MYKHANEVPKTIDQTLPMLVLGSVPMIIRVATIIRNQPNLNCYGK